jgi:hypothetical protein
VIPPGLSWRCWPTVLIVRSLVAERGRAGVLRSRSWARSLPIDLPEHRRFIHFDSIRRPPVAAYSGVWIIWAQRAVHRPAGARDRGLSGIRLAAQVHVPSSVAENPNARSCNHRP